MKTKLLTTLAMLTLAPALASAKEAVLVNQAITISETIAAQNAWCDALVNISTTHANQGPAAAKALAEKVIDGTYAYQMGPVLFKPTLTTNPQTFRTTRAGALSYFVGGDPSFAKDTGFALKGWKKCQPENAGIYTDGNSAMTMGKVHLTDNMGKVTTVDKTWGFVKDDQGKLRINLHHSSLEYAAK